MTLCNYFSSKQSPVICSDQSSEILLHNFLFIRSQMISSNSPAADDSVILVPTNHININVQGDSSIAPDNSEYISDNIFIALSQNHFKRLDENVSTFVACVFVLFIYYPFLKSDLPLTCRIHLRVWILIWALQNIVGCLLKIHARRSTDSPIHLQRLIWLRYVFALGWYVLGWIFWSTPSLITTSNCTMGENPVLNSVCLSCLIYASMQPFSPIILWLAIKIASYVCFGCMSCCSFLLESLSPYGASEKLINQFPIVEYTVNLLDETHNQCAICSLEYQPNDKLRVLPCNTVQSHYFHQTCIDSWLVSHYSCPQCHYEFSTQ